MVFTAQGACDTRAEAILTQIADAIADAEGIPKSKIKADMMEEISISIARSVVRAVLRRPPAGSRRHAGNVARVLAAAGALEV